MTLTRKQLLAGILALSTEERSALVDDILETYCSMCAEPLDEDGDCPEGCDPDDMLEDDEDEDEDRRVVQ
jgi:hypothetical protein